MKHTILFLTMLILILFVTISNSAPVSFNFTVNNYEVNRAKNRVNIGWVGDGFRAADTTKYLAYIDSTIKYQKGTSGVSNNMMTMRPFGRYDKFFNRYVVNLISVDSGIGATPSWSYYYTWVWNGSAWVWQGDTLVKNTPLKGTHDGGTGRLGWANDSLTDSLFDDAKVVIGDTLHWKFVVLNSMGYYNAGGRYPTWAMPQWGEISHHECGHSFYGFGDEYYSCTGSSDYVDHGELNISIASVHKWDNWVGYKDVDPRLRSRGEACGSTNADTVGYFEAARYVQTGQFRPTTNSKMGWTESSTPTSWNVICREKIIQSIWDIVKPLDTFRIDTGTTPITNPDTLWVSPIDTHVVHVDWYVDGVLRKLSGGSKLPKDSISFTIGTHIVRAHAYDEAIRHRFSTNSAPDTLDLVRGDTSRMFQDVSWTVNLTTAPPVDSILIGLNDPLVDTIRVGKGTCLTAYTITKPVRCNVLHFISTDTVKINTPVMYVRDSLIYNYTSIVKTLNNSKVYSYKGYPLVVLLNGKIGTPKVVCKGSTILWR